MDEEVTEHLCCSGEGDARVWLATMMTTLKHDDQVKVFVTLWAIWHARRKAIHEQIFQIPLTVHHFVESFIGELVLIKDTKKPAPATALSTDVQAWIPPPRGWTKINVDAAVGKNTGRGTVAAVARDEGGVLRSIVSRFPGMD